MSTSAQLRPEQSQPLPAYRSILLAVDSSDHSNHGTSEAVGLATQWDSLITAAHVYAAEMHDVRFRQMEGGLPEQFRKEEELERQREVHDDLITRGLSIITDCYLDQVEQACNPASVRFARRSLEGKNYRALTEETNSGHYDLLILGAQGVGAIEGGRLGTVCERVARRSQIDTLVIKDPQRPLSSGPIVVAVDGSARAHGGVLTAIALANCWQVPIKVVAAFDPYYHYVAFNRIADVLSEDAGKVFRFQEQEKLHEDIIDSGLAKIYQGHLGVAQSIADEYGTGIELLDGKPHDAIEKYLRRVQPSLLIIGKLGIHADPELDIGGNAEQLLRHVDCSVLLSQRAYRPRTEVLAEITTSWTTEAERRIKRAPSFVRSMARLAILRYAQERGHTVITERIVEEATAQLMPAQIDPGANTDGPTSTAAMGLPVWTAEADDLLQQVSDPTARANLEMRAEKKARVNGCNRIERHHIDAFVAPARVTTAAGNDGARVQAASANPLHWKADALARLMRVPEGCMRDMSRARIEKLGRETNTTEISLEVAERGLAEARQAMEQAVRSDRAADVSSSVSETTNTSKCPFGHTPPPAAVENKARPASKTSWNSTALELLQRVPEGFCRDMTAKAAETLAARNAVGCIDDAFLNDIMRTFEAGARSVAESMPWEAEARTRINKAPEIVRGMLIKEVEGWAQRKGLQRVNQRALDAVKSQWAQRGVFHLDPDDPRSH